MYVPAVHTHKGAHAWWSFRAAAHLSGPQPGAPAFVTDHRGVLHHVRFTALSDLRRRSEVNLRTRRDVGTPHSDRPSTARPCRVCIAQQRVAERACVAAARACVPRWPSPVAGSVSAWAMLARAPRSGRDSLRARRGRTLLLTPSSRERPLVPTRTGVTLPPQPNPGWHPTALSAPLRRTLPRSGFMQNRALGARRATRSRVVARAYRGESCWARRSRRRGSSRRQRASCSPRSSPVSFCEPARSYRAATWCR